MSLFSQLLGINAIFVLLSLVLYVIFGQVTVRRLRKNSVTKKALGLEFASGWDIINVAQALSLPRSITKKLERSSLSFMYADSNLLRQNTTFVDRIIAALFYWMFILSSLAMVVLVSLNGLGLI
jgi:hypothetical protein